MRRVTATYAGELSTVEAAKLIGGAPHFWNSAIRGGHVLVTKPAGVGRGNGAKIDAISAAEWWDRQQQKLSSTPIAA